VSKAKQSPILDNNDGELIKAGALYCALISAFFSVILKKSAYGLFIGTIIYK